MGPVRVVEVMAALSLTTDLATGVPFEKGLQVCLVADRIAERMGLGPETRRDAYHAALLRSIGCTAHAPENAAEFVDDTAFQAVLKRLDPGDPETFAKQLASFGAWADPSLGLADRFVEIAPEVGPIAAATGCEVSRALAPRMGATAAVVRALDDVYERWDGLGIPVGRSGHELAEVARVLHVAEQLVLTRAEGDDPFEDVRRRAGGHLDPGVVAAAVDLGPGLMSVLDVPDVLLAVLDGEPGPRLDVRGAQVGDLCAVLGAVADLKSTYLLGHSAHVALVALGAARGLGLDEAAQDRLRCAALLHALGCVVVPSSELDAVNDLVSATGRERMRLQAHWTGRVLERCPSLAGLAPLCRPAIAWHSSLAEGNHRSWVRSADLPAVGTSLEADVLEAAEVWATLREPRPGRAVLDAREAATVLHAAARAGLLDQAAVTAVVDSGLGRRTPHPRDPDELTAREVDVLRLAARGLSNRDIGASLGISDRTVGHHLAHVYDKTGLRTRAGVAVWAMERGLLP